MTTNGATICASYERVSTRAQGQHGFSLGVQHQSLDDFARAQGWTLPEHLRFRDGEEADASGADWDLPGLTAMLEAAQRQEFTVLVVPDFDRFARSMVKGLVLEEQLKKLGVRVAFQRVPVEDTPEGNLLKTQLYAFAEYDRQKIVLRTTMGRRAKAQTGKVVGSGPVAYGYRFTHETLPNGKVRVCGLESDPLTAPVARETLLALRHRSTLDVMADLNRRGIPGPRGGSWNATTLHRMGRNPVYRGEWRYARRGPRSAADDPAAISVAVAPLVAPAEWGEIQAALDRRVVARRGRTPIEDDPFLLRGRLTCGHCHGTLWTVTNNGSRYYLCGCVRPSDARRFGKARCDLPGLNAAAVETELWRLLTATLLDPDALAAGLAAARSHHEQADHGRRDRLAILDGEIAKQRKRLDVLAGRFADAGDGEVFNALMRQAKDIEGLISRLDRERADLAAVRAEGLSDTDAAAIETFAATMRTGIAHATAADQHELYELLQVRGTVHADPNGIRLGRTHRFRIDWQGAIPLCDSGNNFKTMVVDDKIALIMTLNLSNNAFQANRDFGVITTEPAHVAQASGIFDADWTGAQPPDGPLIVSPIDSRPELLALIGGAQSTLDVYAEVVRDREIVDALKATASRGVAVRLIMSTETFESDPIRLELAAAGVQVRLVDNPYVHAKMLLADGIRSFVGSQNLTQTSLDENRELGLILTDPINVLRLQSVFDADFATGVIEH